MKPTEIEPLHSSGRHYNPRPDWLTQGLLWTAFFLLAAVAALITDLWLWPASDGPVAQAIEPTVAAYVDTPMRTVSSPAPTARPTSSPTNEPTLPATIEPTASTEPPAVEPTASPNALLAEAISPTAVTPQACVPPDDWGLHIVQPGNTLYSIAQRYGTDVDTLMYVNCLNTLTIFVDQRLYVPGPVATPTPPAGMNGQMPIATASPRPAASATPSMELSVDATRVPTATPRSTFQVNIPEHYLNIVLLGSDKRPSSGAWRTDSMIVVSVDTTNNIVRLLSIPRDLWVSIPGHGYNRINTAELWGELAKKGTGTDRVKQTIYQNLGIPVHYYVRVDFQGFIKIIDTVGGIDVDVDCPLSDINLSAGMHHMDGKQALRYARSRKSTNDFDRGRRQRKVLMALWDQALTMDIIPKLPQLWWTMNDTFQTDLPLNQVINLAYTGVHLKPQHILSQAIGPSQVQSWMTPQGASVLLPREDKIRAMLEDFYAPVDPNRLDAVSKARVRVLNGSSRREAEELASSALHWAGFAVTDSGMAERQDYAQTRILLLNGDMSTAEQLAGELRVPKTAIQDLTATQEQPNPDKPVDIQVILGRDYNPCQR